MELYLIEVCDFDDKCRTIRRGVRGSLETAKTLVSKLIDEYIKQDYAIIALGKSWGYALDSERKENEFCERWWSVIALRLMQIRDKYMNK